VKEDGRISVEILNMTYKPVLEQKEKIRIMDLSFVREYSGLQIPIL
jgi:hypothetical protein